MDAVKDFKSGNYARGALNTAKTIADIGLMFVKASPVGLIASLAYSVFDIWTSKSDE